MGCKRMLAWGRWHCKHGCSGNENCKCYTWACTHWWRAAGQGKAGEINTPRGAYRSRLLDSICSAGRRAAGGGSAGCACMLPRPAHPLLLLRLLTTLLKALRGPCPAAHPCACHLLPHPHHPAPPSMLRSGPARRGDRLVCPHTQRPRERLPAVPAGVATGAAAARRHLFPRQPAAQGAGHPGGGGLVGPLVGGGGGVGGGGWVWGSSLGSLKLKDHTAVHRGLRVQWLSYPTVHHWGRPPTTLVPSIEQAAAALHSQPTPLPIC